MVFMIQPGIHAGREGARKQRERENTLVHGCLPKDTDSHTAARLGQDVVAAKSCEKRT